MSRPSGYVDPALSPWHLLGSALRHWRDEVRRMSLRTVAESAFVDDGDLSKWERGLARPSAGAVERIDLLLNAGGQLVALYATVLDLDRLRTLVMTDTPMEEAATDRRDLLRMAAVSALGAAGGGEYVRQLFEAPRPLAEWELACADHLHALRTRPPAQVSADLTVDLLALRAQLDAAPAGGRTELLRMTAVLAAIQANALTRLADHGAAIRWWRTARHSAETAGDRDLGLLVRGEEAGHGLYGQRSPETVLRLVEAAEALAGRPAVELLDTRAKALSMLGRHAEALEVMDQASAVVGSKRGDSLGFWRPNQFYFAQSWVYAAAGREQRALTVGQIVLDSSSDYVYRANVQLHRALCAVAKGGTQEGARTAATVFAELNPSYLSSHVLETGRLVLRAVPIDQRGQGDAGELRRLLTVTPSLANANP
jgi:transcriptional regulator with XRE-family HTH domain